MLKLHTCKLVADSHFSRSADRSAKKSLIAELLNPHLIFCAFLENTSWDYSILLDLLMSPETHFLAYLVYYLKYLAQNWLSLIDISQIRSSSLMKEDQSIAGGSDTKVFPNKCELMQVSTVAVSLVSYSDSDSDCCSDMCTRSQSSDTSKTELTLPPGASSSDSGKTSRCSDEDEMENCCLQEQCGNYLWSPSDTYNRRDNLSKSSSDNSNSHRDIFSQDTGDTSQSKVDDLHEPCSGREKELVDQHYLGFPSGDDPPESSLQACMTASSSDYSGTMIMDMISVLIRLRLAINRLLNKGLFPYNAEPLLCLLEQCEMIFEQGSPQSSLQE